MTVATAEIITAGAATMAAPAIPGLRAMAQSGAIVAEVETAEEVATVEGAAAINASCKPNREFMLCLCRSHF
jgi:hypothetical protein